jgi:hypothetical protein
LTLGSGFVYFLSSLVAILLRFGGSLFHHKTLTFRILLSSDADPVTRPIFNVDADPDPGLISLTKIVLVSSDADQDMRPTFSF